MTFFYFQKNFLCILIITILFPFILTKTSETSDDSDFLSIHQLTDSNFESNVNNGINKPWFLIFYIDSCPHCRNAKSSLENISKNPDLVAKSNIKLGLIDCDSNMFTCYRFKISRVPYIVILDSNHMYELNEYPSKDNIVRFINLKKDSEEGLVIPSAMGYLEFFYKSLEEVVHLLDTNIESYLRNSLKIEIEWKSEYTLLLLALVLIIIVVVEYTILSIICRVPKKTVKENKNLTDESKKNQEDKIEENKNNETNIEEDKNELNDIKETKIEKEENISETKSDKNKKED